MNDKKKDILVGVMVIFTVMVFALGMILWPYMPKNNAVLNKLYYLTTSSVLYFFSLIVFIIATGKLLKIASCIGLGIFSVNLYVELFLDPTHWTAWSAGLIVAVSVNMWLTVNIIERLRIKNK